MVALIQCDLLHVICATCVILAASLFGRVPVNIASNATIKALMLWDMFTFSRGFLLKYDLISVTSMLQAHNGEAKHAAAL